MKKAIALSLVVALLASLAACATAPIATQAPTPARTATPTAIPTMTATPVPSASPTPSPTFLPKVTTTPEPEEAEELEPTYEPNPSPEYDIPDLKKVGLTNQQYHLIQAMLSSTNYFQFSHVSKISRDNLVQFAYFVIDDFADAIKYDYCKETFTKEEIEKIIKSAFSINYQAKDGDGVGYTGLVYKDGVFHFEAGEGNAVPWPSTYSVTKIAPDKLQIRYNVLIVGGGFNINVFSDKREAILQKDDESIFGYHFISVKQINTTPKFNNASASSWLPDKRSKSYMPKFCIDGDNNTGWSADLKDGAWVKLSSSKIQAISGVSFTVGDRSALEENDDFDSGYTKIKMEFSDGTSITSEIYNVYYKDGCYSIDFNREVKTKYIKITIISSDNDPIYIAEIEPF